MSALVQEKVAQAQAILGQQDVDSWLVFVRETTEIPDPILPLIFGSDLVWASALILDRQGRHTALVGSGDAHLAQSTGVFETVVGYDQSLRPHLLEALHRLAPRTIAINFSKFNNIADGLTHGMYLFLTEDLLGATPWARRLVSADDLVTKLRGRKSPEELRRIKAAVAATEDLLRRLTGRLRVGMTEIEIFDWLKAEMQRLGLEDAWSPDYNPGINTGPSSPYGHAGPSDIAIEPGHVLRLDFGVKVEDYCADLQRNWYFLRPGEDAAPTEVQRAFDAVLAAVDRSAAALRPGVMGWQVDKVARDTLAEHGYPEYMHALGHQVGRMAHDGGASLGPRWPRYGDRPYVKIEKDGVFTIEPGTATPAGTVQLEENVVVTADGCEFLSTQQRELILVRG